MLARQIPPPRLVAYGGGRLRSEHNADLAGRIRIHFLFSKCGLSPHLASIAEFSSVQRR